MDYVCFLQTYCVDRQVADSACSATAYLCGIKANEGTIGVTAQVPRSECSPSTNVSTHVPSIARWSQLKNKRTGVVTNTRITHASPTGKRFLLLSFFFIVCLGQIIEIFCNNNLLTIK